MSIIAFTNARIVDGTSEEASDPQTIVVEGGTIREVSAKPKTPRTTRVIDLAGKFVMPGLIDAHVHVVAAMANLGENAKQPNEVASFRAARIMRDMLARGFTTVRDVGGAGYGLVVAQEQGLIEGPRLVISGKALGQTGGHTDFRGRFDDRGAFENRVGALGRLVDGVDQIRKAAREEIKGGAHFIKIMANGGVASPTDPIHFLGFSKDEIRAVVEEAENAGTYVSAHLYTDEAIARAVECGVHSLEHCNLIRPDTAKKAAKVGAVAVPTLVTYDALANEGASLGLPAESVAKIETVRKAGLESLSIMRKAKLAMAYGSDLLGEMHRHQSEEFVIRTKVLPVHEVIASATHVAAKLLGLEGKIGVLAEGAHADMIVVEGNPLDDPKLLTGQGAHLPMILQAGRFVKGG
jgi:imidazolonepropionase-like amidohydrolase